MPVLIVGSIAIDDIRTPTEAHPDLLGGSASYASLSASYFAPVNLVGIVGTDFPQRYLELFGAHQIDLQGVEVAEGKTFRWTGEYEADMNKRQTLEVALNVFETFRPTLPSAYLDTPMVLLGNISPDLQTHVLDQMHAPQFVVADTMDLWIMTARPELMNLLPRVDLLVLNDGEARQLTGEENLIRAGRAILDCGPKYVAIKKGEHGCVLMSPGEFFSCGAHPLEAVVDPTGAGDTFAGGLVGFLAGQKPAQVTFVDLKRAVVHGSLMASFSVESFSVDAITRLSPKEIQARYQSFVAMSHFDA
ncbi:MAG TPA: PfkB family carbohydrate kinase [Chthoniobacterales bacterium]